MLDAATMERVRGALAVLVGERLSDMWRYGACQRFEFGEQNPFTNRKGESSTRADRALIEQCAWMITGPRRFVLASTHFGRVGGRRDRFAEPFYESLANDGPKIESFDLGGRGEFIIRMSGGYTLFIAPNQRLEEDPEEWRYLGVEGVEASFVLHGRRVYWGGEGAQFDPSDAELD